ncbi:MAG: hypothetical protein WC254_06670 [Candidatus Woesearchaeota archaeon]|jgi:uncharacterized membrane protein
MKNKTVGIFIIIIALIIGLIIYLFNRALTVIVNTACAHGPECPMWGSIKVHTYLSIILMIGVIAVGVYFIFAKEKIVDTKEQKKDIAKLRQKLTADEKIVIDKIVEAEGSIFQSDLVEKTSFPKVKVTRILDKLEGMQVIERKRRGMTNVVILKH